MEKKKAIQALSEHFKTGTSDADIAALLGISRQAVFQWPSVLTRSILQSTIAGGLVGRRLPKEIIQAINDMRSRGEK